MRSTTDSLQGTLVMLVLKALASRGPIHGYGITSHIHAVSNALVRVEEGSLYPALHRLEHEGLVKAEWGLTDKNRRARFYSLTAKGRQRLEAEAQSWTRLADGIRRVLRHA